MAWCEGFWDRQAPLENARRKVAVSSIHVHRKMKGESTMMMSRMSLLGLAMLLFVSAPAFAIPINNFSGTIRDWTLRPDPTDFIGLYYVLAFEGITVPNFIPPATTMNFTYTDSAAGGAKIVRNSAVTTDLGTFGNIHLSRTSFQFKAGEYVDLNVQDGMGNRAMFRVELKSLVSNDTYNLATRTGSSAIFINAAVDYTELIAFDNDVDGNLVDLLNMAVTWAFPNGDWSFTLNASQLRGAAVETGKEQTFTGYITSFLGQPGTIELVDPNLTSGSFSASSVPEPTTLALVGAGLLSAVGLRRRKA